MNTLSRDQRVGVELPHDEHARGLGRRREQAARGMAQAFRRRSGSRLSASPGVAGKLWHKRDWSPTRARPRWSPLALRFYDAHGRPLAQIPRASRSQTRKRLLAYDAPHASCSIAILCVALVVWRSLAALPTRIPRPRRRKSPWIRRAGVRARRDCRSPSAHGDAHSRRRRHRRRDRSATSYLFEAITRTAAHSTSIVRVGESYSAVVEAMIERPDRRRLLPWRRRLPASEEACGRGVLLGPSPVAGKRVERVLLGHLRPQAIRR